MATTGKRKHPRSRRLAGLWLREVPPTLKLSAPITAGMVSQMIIGLSDTLMVGQVGVTPLAAAAFVNAVVYLPMVFAVGLLASVTVLASQAFGAKEPAEAGEALRHGLALTVALGAAVVAALFALLPFLRFLGQPSEVIAEARSYLMLVGLSMFPLLLAHTSKQFSEALNEAWAPNWILLSGALLNIFLNWVFIFGHLGAPAMGLNGAGLATLLARIAMAAGALVFVLRSKTCRPYQPPRWLAKFSMERFRRLLALGWPIGAQHLMEVGAFSFAGLMMGWISANALAAHQIALTCAATTFMFPFGIGMGSCIRVGHAWGARQYSRLRRIGFAGIGLAACVMAVFGVIFILGGRFIAGLFVDSPEVVDLTAKLFIIAALFQIADGLQVTALSSLRGLNDVRVPAMIAVLSYWVIAVPMALGLGFPAGLGAFGVWIGLATGLGVAAVCLTWRFWIKSKQLK